MLRRCVRFWHRRLSTASFVSRHYELDNPSCIPEFLERKKISFASSATHYKVCECPFCHDTKGLKTNLFKLYIERHTGLYFCHRCGSSGHWMTFKQRVGDSALAIDSISSSLGKSPTQHFQPLEHVKATTLQRNLTAEPHAAVLDYLTNTRGLSTAVLDKYGVGCLVLPSPDQPEHALDHKWITFPWMARDGDLQDMGATNVAASGDANHFHVFRIKARHCTDKAKQMMLPKGGCWGLFGWHTVPQIATEIVLTEGEYDAMAVHQATGKAAVSLPNGCRSLPPAILPLLERFSTIYLWLDQDLAGQDSVRKFSAKLGLKRCRVVAARGDEGIALHGQLPVPPKDANEALLRGLDLQVILDRAAPLPHEQIATFTDLRQEVFQEILQPMDAAGMQSNHFPGLNRILKGHRLGEVSIVTGPTGCGKTTFLSQLSLDYCQQGIRTLWGSFEIKNTRLLKKMLMQYAGQDLSRVSRLELEGVADTFEALPLYFMRYFGSSDVDQVLDAMEHAVYAYDVQHVVLDNLQFMMSGQGKGFDKYERQDAALDKFRKFASNNNVHLSLVIHPRKEHEDTDLSLASVFGTAKATQEADNVLILQRRIKEGGHELKLDIRKNRYDGTLGAIPLQFDQSSVRLFEPQDDQQLPLNPPLDLQSTTVEDENPTTFELQELAIQEVEALSPSPVLETVHLTQSEPFAQFTQIIPH